MPPVSVFISYSHADEKEKDELVAHLKLLRHESIVLWADNDLHSGEDWEAEILSHIRQSKIAVLLITTGFLNSEFIQSRELPELLKRRETNTIAMLPVYAKSCAYRRVPWLRTLQLRTRKGRPLWSGSGVQTNEQLAGLAEEIANLARGALTAAAAPSKDALANPLKVRYKPKRTRKELCTVIKRIDDYLEREAVQKLFGLDAIRQRKKQLTLIESRLENELTVAVIGPFKRGKSSLINALLQSALVPSDIAPETITINEIRYGDSLTVEACLLNGGSVELPYEALRSVELSTMLSQLDEEVTHLDIHAPLDWLRGICIVDTPGTGDLFQRFDRKVHEYLVRADAVLFVLSPLEPFSQSEREYLRLALLAQDFAKVVFVANMLDKLHHESDVSRMLNILRTRIAEMFPDALLFGVSAADELARLSGEARPRPERGPALAAAFASLRAYLDESIVLNREIIQLDRAIDEFLHLLAELSEAAGRLTWAIDRSQSRIDEAISTGERERIELPARITEITSRVAEEMRVRGQQTVDWLTEFFDRLAETGYALASFGSEPLQKHFSFFLADAVRTALQRCLESHRTSILILVREAGLQLRQHEFTVAFEARAAAVGSVGMAQQVAEAGFGQDIWERLDAGKLFGDIAQSGVFGMVTTLIDQFGRSSRDTVKAMLFQQHFQKTLPQLRRTVLAEAELIYGDISGRFTAELEREAHEQMLLSLQMLRQGRELHADGGEEKAALDELPSIIDSARHTLQNLQKRLREDL